MYLVVLFFIIHSVVFKAAQPTGCFLQNLAHLLRNMSSIHTPELVIPVTFPFVPPTCQTFSTETSSPLDPLTPCGQHISHNDQSAILHFWKIASPPQLLLGHSLDAHESRVASRKHHL